MSDSGQSLHTYRASLLESLNRSETASWNEQPGAALARYTWRSWYRWTQPQADRLLAEASIFHPGNVGVGGLTRLHDRIMTIIDGIGPAPAPISSLKNPQVRLPPLESNVDYGQLTCDVASRDRVAEEICRDFPYGGRVLFLGDDDLVSEAVALAGFSVTVVDVDERIGQCLATVEADLSFVLGDVRRPLEAGQFDAVVLDPADGSVALNHWLNRVHEHLGDEEGVRVYLSVNMHRLGRRWASLLAGLARRDLVPVRSQERIKRYPSPSWADTTTDLWVFERMALPSSLPVPYVEIETNR